MLTILEAATSANLTKDKARYWLKLLNIEPIKKDRTLLFSDDCSALLEAMKKAVEAGIPPVAAAAEIRATFAAPAASVPTKTEQGNAEMIARLNSLESAVILLAESNKQLSEQNSRLVDLVQNQNRKLESIAARLPAPPPEVATIRKIQKKAEVKVPLLKRLWLELFDPIQLRATP